MFPDSLELCVDSDYVVHHGNEHIDYAELSERLFGEDDLIKHLVEIFVEDNKDRISQLAQAINNHDLEQIKIDAHAIKGAALTVSAKKIAQLCLDIEEKVKNNILADIQEMYENIQNEFRIFCEITEQSNWIDLLKH